ncbi:MAG: sulfurtransferase TusA family protein [Candidatus Poribacteria bacterium]|nr:sulfurtransferase TusA family protein [Candidatus Poribacteria bacterium]
MNNAQYEPSEVIDASGLQCPMPLVRASQAARKVDIGAIIQVISTDRGSVPDFQAWVKRDKKVELLSQNEQPGDGGRTVYVHFVKRIA